MKIRNGFVSNSSSSSFLIYGTTIDISDIDMPDDVEDSYEYLEEKFKDTDINVYYVGDDDGYYYIGKSWSNIGDDETGKQFKNNVENILKEKLGNEIKCCTHSEAWYD
jgi:hypothetical protein